MDPRDDHSKLRVWKRPAMDTMCFPVKTLKIFDFVETKKDVIVSSPVSKEKNLKDFFWKQEFGGRGEIMFCIVWFLCQHSKFGFRRISWVLGNQWQGEKIKMFFRMETELSQPFSFGIKGKITRRRSQNTQIKLDKFLCCFLWPVNWNNRSPIDWLIDWLKYSN